LADLADAVKYVGSSDHKINPGDFGLTICRPRPNATLCDGAKILRRKVAVRYLKSGIQRGLVSQLESGDWPKYIWAVTDDGIPLEAQGDSNGDYHGYPMESNDPFRDEVIKRWQEP